VISLESLRNPDKYDHTQRATVVRGGRKVNINLRGVLGHLQRYIKLMLITATGGKQTRYAGADQPPERLDPEAGVGAAKCSYPQYARRQTMTGPSFSAFCFLLSSFPARQEAPNN